MKKKSVILSAVVTTAVLSAGSLTAFAVSSDAYSYLAGQQRSANRNDLYAQAAQLPADEQDNFLAENGIGETEWSEEAAASYSYVSGRQRGVLYEDDTEDKTDYGYITGQETGSSYVDTEDGSSYSYLAGQQRSANRNDLYAQAAQLPEDEQDDFLAENGIGETEWSEEAAASYSYVCGRQRGASYRQSDDSERTQDTSGYGYLTGQQRGSSYHK